MFGYVKPFVPDLRVCEHELYERLKSFCAQHGYTTTEAVCESLVKFMDSFEDSGKEDGGYFLY